jgi:hydroxyacylglutathione hydrolase
MDNLSMEAEKAIKVYPIPALRDNYVWVLVDGKQAKAIIVDPGDATPVIAYLNAHCLTLEAIFVTHHHWDHTNGIADILEYAQAPVIGAENSPCQYITRYVQGEETLTITTDFPNFDIISIPGHTLDHIAYYARPSNSSPILFCGDTLFGAGCGRIFEGNPEMMYRSLEKIAALPDNTLIYCGHEYTMRNLEFASLAEPHNMDIQRRIQAVRALRDINLSSVPSTCVEEKKTNPFFRMHIPEVIDGVERHFQERYQNPVEVFAALRRWKDNF